MNLRQLYKAIPMPLKKAIFRCIPYKLAAGKSYRRTLQLCRKSETFSPEEIKDFQEKHLRKILIFAVDHVPFYRKYRDLVYNADSALEVLAEFPVMTKSDVQKNFNDLIPDCIKQIKHITARTGGSTGNQLIFYQDSKVYSIEMGFMHSQWARVGYHPSCRKATFRGVTFENLPAGVFWQDNPVHNELQFSPFHMSENNMPLYIKKLQEYKPQFLHGYPSALSVLADYIIRNGLTGTVTGIKAALCGSEKCDLQQRQKIEEAFGTRVYTWYGQSERVILAGECENNSAYHVLPAYGITEILNENNKPVQPGEFGELTGTGFWNYSMPLIRYKTGDFARAGLERCTCGRNMMLLKNLEGRWNISGIIGHSGTQISAAALNVHEDVFDNVTRFQYYQETPGQLEIRVEPGEKFSNDDEKAILAVHHAKLGDEVTLSLRLLDKIPLTSGGKFLKIINNCHK